jgi:hypothetical protein
MHLHELYTYIVYTYVYIYIYISYICMHMDIGLPYDATDDDILSFFETCGHIQSVRLPKWHDSGTYVITCTCAHISIHIYVFMLYVYIHSNI